MWGLSRYLLPQLDKGSTGPSLAGVEGGALEPLWEGIWGLLWVVWLILGAPATLLPGSWVLSTPGGGLGSNPFRAGDAADSFSRPFPLYATLSVLTAIFPSEPPSPVFLLESPPSALCGSLLLYSLLLGSFLVCLFVPPLSCSYSPFLRAGANNPILLCPRDESVELLLENHRPIVLLHDFA